MLRAEKAEFEPQRDEAVFRPGPGIAQLMVATSGGGEDGV